MGFIGFNAGIGEHMSALKNPETQLVVVIKVHVPSLQLYDSNRRCYVVSAWIRSSVGCGQCVGQDIHTHSLCKYPCLTLRTRTSNVNIVVTNISR